MASDPSIGERLYALLSATIPAASVAIMVAEQGADFPHITFQSIYSTTENVLSGNGNPPIGQTRMQIDVWAKTYAEAQSLSKQVSAALLGWDAQNVQIGSRDAYQSDVRIYRVILEYSIWHR